MKIGYLVPEFPSQTHAFFWREARAIEETGTKLQFLSTRRPAPDACPHAFRDEAVARTHYVFPPSGAALRALAAHPVKAARALGYIAGLSETPAAARLRLAALLAAAAELGVVCQREGLEHVHIHSCANAAHLGALLVRLGGPSYSLTLHGDLPVYGSDHAAKMSAAAFVSAVTRPLAEQVVGVAPGKRAPVIMMGVDCDAFHPPEPPRTRAADDPLTLLTVARLNKTKGHRHTLEAIAALVAEGLDLRYRIVGSGPEEAAIRADIDRLGLADRVEMLGALDQVQVYEALLAADVMTLTSFGQGEAAPVTVMEAMATGLPVVVSRIGGTPDMVEDGVDSYLTPQQDAGAIADAIRRLATDPQHARTMGEAARQKALSAFDFRANAGKLLEEIRATAH